MQHRCKLERQRASGLVTYQGCVEPRALRFAGLHSLGRCREADRLISECGQHLLMPQQALSIGLEHQYRFAKASPGCARPCRTVIVSFDEALGSQMSKRVPLPTILSTPTAPSCCWTISRTGRQAQTVAPGARREEWFEDPLQCGIVHAAPRIGNRNDHEAAGTDVNPPDARRA